ncbi:MAG: tRNA (guanosine(46)-N7)-methyltransferase TrmB [Pseudomonadota bacterium]
MSLGEKRDREAVALRSFGRRRGRKPSPRQARLLAELLPRVAIDLAAPPPSAATELFPLPVREVWLEIGFGGGEHLVWQAARQPDVGLIGAEPFEDGVVKVLTRIEEQALRNVRLVSDDARPLLAWLPPASIARAFVLFPDPWPKARHRKRRLVGRELLDQLARVMRPGGTLRLATDIGDYAGGMLEAAVANGAFTWQVESPADWRQRAADWPETRYEAKARAAGRKCYFLTFLHHRAEPSPACLSEGGASRG